MLFRSLQRHAVIWKAWTFLLLPLWVGSVRSDAFWTTGYYPGWTQSYMPPSAIDFSALTHVIHFSVLPQSDGTVNSVELGLTSAASATLISRAHAAGCKVLLCVGGAGTQSGFKQATTPDHLSGFISNLVSLLKSRGYDGIDVDWEPLETVDTLPFQKFIKGLRTALEKSIPHSLLTAAVANEPALVAGVHSQFDQVNVMTYDQAGPWDGWVTWFNAPLYDGGYRFASSGGLINSADGLLNQFLTAGVPAGKLGIGLAFYGNVWSGGAGFSTGGPSLPRQSWTSPPVVTALTYSDIISKYYQPGIYHWDTLAQSAYLSIDNPGGVNDKFISYDDEHGCQAKVSYARNRSLGGVMIWQLAGDYQASQPEEKRHVLLRAVKEASQPPRFSGIRVLSSETELSLDSIPLALYRVEWTSHLISSPWTVLTNLTGTGETLRVKDTSSFSQAERYYRIRIP